jgi:cell division protein FtsL
MLELLLLHSFLVALMLLSTARVHFLGKAGKPRVLPFGIALYLVWGGVLVSVIADDPFIVVLIVLVFYFLPPILGWGALQNTIYPHLNRFLEEVETLERTQVQSDNWQNTDWRELQIESNRLWYNSNIDELFRQYQRHKDKPFFLEGLKADYFFGRGIVSTQKLFKLYYLEYGIRWELLTGKKLEDLPPKKEEAIKQAKTFAEGLEEFTNVLGVLLEAIITGVINVYREYRKQKTQNEEKP